MRYDDGDPDDDSEFESEFDADLRDEDDDADEPTVPCPFCRREILEDTPRCPHCERYLSPEDFARGAKPLWVIATAVVCLAIAIGWALAMF